jgi:hypothetical protein
MENVALIKRVFIRLVERRSVRFLEQRINITFSVKLQKNASDPCAMFSEAHGGEDIKSQVFLGGINGSKKARMSMSQMKTMFVTFFDIMGIVCSL